MFSTALDKLPRSNYNESDFKVTLLTKHEADFMKTTKKEILDAALTVFSEKGYEGAFLRDIAASLGITKPALYKHFESKEALWDAMIASVEKYYGESFAAVSGAPVPDSWDEFCTLTFRQIDFTLHDETVRRVRRLLMLEQFRSERMSALSTKHFITDIEERYTKIFSGMMEKGLIRAAEPRLLAFQYTAPVTVMIHLCDREPEKEAEIMKKIEAHIRQFSDEHRAK